MRKNKFLTLLLAICIILPVTLTLTACHKHSYSESWSTNETNHWHACTGEDCEKTKDNAEHTFTTKTDATYHWQECSVCGYKKNSAEHTFTTKTDATYHWQECSVCGYKKNSAEHTYTNGEDLDCDSCGAKRTKTTLAFKDGTYSLTYNGGEQSFDKASLVSTNVSLDDVIVEYSASKTEPSWTTEVKDAGTYYIRLRVETTASHTGCTIDNLADDTKKLTVNKKELSLAELKWVYAKAQLTNGNHTVKLTHGGFSGVCGSDRIELNMYISNATSFTEGEEWVLREQYDTTHLTKALAVSITNNDNTSNKNYKLNKTEVGKLLVAKDMTASGSGTTEAPDTYTVTESIAKNQVVYYATKLSRTNRRKVVEGGFTDEYTLSLTSGVEIVEVIINNDEDICVTINADGSVIMFGEEDTPTIIFGLKYTGESESVSNTFTLTENIVERTISAQLDLEKALRFSLGGGYKVVTKKNGSVIETHKHQAFTGYTNYYQNYAGTEMYYTLIEGKDNYYIFSKNASGKWVRDEVNVSENYANLNEVKAELLKDSFAWINAIDATGAFNTFTFSEEDLMYHTTNSYLLNDSVMTTRIALKFEDGKLLYVEFTDGTDTYTVEITNSADSVTVEMPTTGLFKTNATSVSYSTDNSKFLLENVTLFAGDNWFEVNITEDLFNANKKSTTNKCEIDGEFTTESTATLTIVGEDASGNSIPNNKSTQNGKLNFQSLSNAGKYYIKITVTENCTGSISIEFKGKIAF